MTGTAPDFQQKPQRNRLSTVQRLIPYFKGHENSLVKALISVILRTSVLTLVPLLFRNLLDDAIPSGSLNYIFMVGGLYFTLLVLNLLLEYGQQIVVGFMGLEIVTRIKVEILEHILSLSLRFFDTKSPGTLVSRVESDTQRLFMVFSSVGLTILMAGLQLILAFSIMLMTSVQLTLYIVAVSPLFIGVTYMVFIRMRPMFRKEREYYARIPGFLSEHIRAISLLRNLNNLNWSIRKFADINEDKRAYEIKINLIEASLWYFLMLAPQLAIAGILYQSVAWVQAEAITIGTVWLFIQYIHMIIWPLIEVSEQIGEVQKAFGAADRIFEILDTAPEVLNPRQPHPLPDFQSRISFENISFHYESGKPVLKNINFDIERGSTVAIVGATGSGKSTIINLLTRFYDPVKGRITLDGLDIRQVDQQSILKKMSLVLQDIILFPGNVLDNLRVLRTDIPKERAMQAARQLGVDEFIRGFPGGYDTCLSDQGGNLSFGERQLLSFSRAMTFDPEILIMDEATSSVDPVTESRIQRSLEKLQNDRTAVIIAHRLSTVQHADKILVLNQGELIEEGNHSELMQLNGMYAELYRTQLGEEIHA